MSPRSPSRPSKPPIGCSRGLPACRLEPPKRWRSLARRADLPHVNPGLTAEKAAYGKKSPKSENGAATLASRPGSAERGASGPGVFPAGGEGAAPSPSDFGDFLPWRRVACAEPPSAGPGRVAARSGAPNSPARRAGGALRSARPGGPARGPAGMGSCQSWLTRDAPMR